MAKAKKPFTGLKKPTKSAADLPWPPLPFLYECKHGHQSGGPKPIERCPNFVHGKPCGAPLVRYGKGAGRGAHFKKESQPTTGVRVVKRPSNVD